MDKSLMKSIEVVLERPIRKIMEQPQLKQMKKTMERS